MGSEQVEREIIMKKSKFFSFLIRKILSKTFSTLSVELTQLDDRLQMKFSRPGATVSIREECEINKTIKTFALIEKVLVVPAHLEKQFSKSFKAFRKDFETLMATKNLGGRLKNCKIALKDERTASDELAIEVVVMQRDAKILHLIYPQYEAFFNDKLEQLEAEPSQIPNP